MQKGNENGQAERKMILKKQFEYQDLEQMFHHKEQICGCQGGRRTGERWVGSLGVSIYRMDKQQGPTYNTGDCIQ